MSNTYTSSIINKYNDRYNVPKDCKALHDIIKRQGLQIVIDSIAEHIGRVAIDHELTVQDTDALMDNLLNDLRSAILERT